MPREGYRPRRGREARRRTRGRPLRPALVVTAAAVAVAVVLALVAVPIMGRVAARRASQPEPPVSSAVISVTPTSAVVTLGAARGTGTLRTRPLKPGTYRVRASRRGFETLDATIAVAPGRRTVARFALKGLPQRVSVRVHPSKAKVTVTPAGGPSESASGNLSLKATAGDITLTASAKGYATLTRKLLLDSPLTLDLWLDPVGQLVHTVSAFRCVPAPKGVAVTPNGSQMWVTALVTQPSIEAYDRTGRIIGKVDLGKSGAVEVVFNADGTKAYASQMQSASVFEIDTRTYRVLRKFSTKSSWTKIVMLSPDGTKLYAANWSGDDISEIDLASGKCTRRFHTVDTPRGLWPTADGKSLWVAGFGEQSLVGRIAVIDLATGKSRTIHSVSGGAMRHMVADEKRGVMYTSDMGKARVWVTDMLTMRTRLFVKTDSHPNTIDLSPDGKVLIVSCRGRNNPESYYLPGPEWGSILLFDAETGEPLDAIIGGNQCTALDLSADGRTLVFSDFLDNRLHVYDVPPYATLAAGNGGRFEAHEREVRKAGWSASSDDGEGGGD